MEKYYFLTIIISLIFCVSKRYAYYVLIVGCAVFLMFIPSTGSDYFYYKQAYDNAYFTSSFPWFVSHTDLTSEPFYLWYSSFWSVITPFEFPVFLAINFVVCLFLLSKVFKLFPANCKYYFWVMFLPVIFPTIFYWSPRSSISFILLLCGFILLINKNYLKAGVALFTGCMIHSQFLLAASLIIVTYFIFIRKSLRTKRYPTIIFIISVVLFLFLMNIRSLSALVSSSFEFLPSDKIIASKMAYFKEDYVKHAFRVTSVLSVLVYPVLAIILTRHVSNNEDKRFFFKERSKDVVFIYMLLAVVIYGSVINLAFINEPHISGRLSRFSDYVALGILIPSVFSTITKEYVAQIILIFFCIIAPFIYKTLYEHSVLGF